MSVAKHIFFFITQTLLYVICFAQNEKIDSLKKVLPSLGDSARVDCLNELAINFIFRNRKDSAEYYSALALEEAKNLNYIKGIAGYFAGKALLNNDFIQTEVLARQSLHWYDKTPNKEKIGIAYFVLGSALFSQSKYDEAALYLKKAYHASKKDGDAIRMFYAYSLLGQVYRESGDYDKAFTYFKEGLQMAQHANNEKWVTVQFINIGDLYMAIEDYTTALTYYSRALQGRKKEDIDIWDYTIYAELFSLTQRFDSALHYYNWFDSTRSNKHGLRIFYISKGEYFLLRKEYDSALNYFLKGLSYHQESNDRNQIKRALLDIAKTYSALKNNGAAIKYAKEGLDMALQTKSKQYIRDAYQILYSVFDRLNLKDSAYLYYRLYITMKESVISNQIKAKFSAYNYEQKIELLDKEKQIQQAKLKKGSLLKNLLIAGILILILLAVIVFRNIILKRRNERLRLEYQLELQHLESEKANVRFHQQTTELEMQALRSQMNPHFIFNCLSSINRFILKNETEAASNYLTKFSRLIRMVLTNSKKPFITLEDELETLCLYLDMEKLRFKDSFDYSIHFTNSIDDGNIFVPPLLLQPFAENAIWHGLMHREGQGHLEIELGINKKILTCTMTDNGVGRNKAAEFKSKSVEKQKSMGLQITAERLALLNKDRDKQTFFNIEDITDEEGKSAGTRIILKMNYKDLTEVVPDI